MRIGVVSDLWPPFPGGAERFIFNIARELKRRGHEISVLTSYANAAEFDGIKPTWVSLGVRQYDHQPGHGHADGWRDVFHFLESNRVEVILTHHFFAEEFTEMFDGRWPTIHLVHSGKRNPAASLAIYNSEFTAQRAGRQPQDMVIMPPAFNDCVGDGHGPYIGFIKPIPHKGIDFIYNLADYCSNRQFLILHGEWHECEDIRRGKPNVYFMPPVHEIKTFYSRCHMVLVPSRHEDAGTVPQEAALNSIPCISSNVMGLAQTNAGGIIMPNWSVRDWAIEIDRLENDQRYRTEVALRQRRYIEAINWPAQFDELSRRISW